MIWYSFKQFAGKDLYVLWSYHANTKQLWSKIKLRKSKKCVVTGEMIEKGSMAFRPITNAINRMDRISEKGMEKMHENF